MHFCSTAKIPLLCLEQVFLLYGDAANITVNCTWPPAQSLLLSEVLFRFPEVSLGRKRWFPVIVSLSDCLSHWQFKPTPGRSPQSPLSLPAWTSARLCARDWPWWWTAASDAWVPHSTSKTGASPSRPVSVYCGSVVSGGDPVVQHRRGAGG